jgi:hypothetical protein
MMLYVMGPGGIPEGLPHSVLTELVINDAL